MPSMTRHTKDNKRATVVIEPHGTLKDDQAAAISKRTASVAGLFDRAKASSKKQPKHTTDVSLDVDTLFGFQGATNDKEDSHYRRFLGTVDEYRKNAGSSEVSSLEPVYEKLVARLDGLDVDGNLLQTPDVPTRRDFEELKTIATAMSTPLSEETFQIAIPQADGTMVTKDKTLGQTMLAFNTLVNKKRQELVQLNKQLKAVQQEIAEATDDIRHDRDGAVAATNASFHARTEELKAKVQEEKAAALAEIKAAQKEEKKHMNEKSKKLEEFMKGW